MKKQRNFAHFLRQVAGCVVLLNVYTSQAVTRIPSGIIDFCHRNVRYTVSTEVCPGGIRFLNRAFRPDYDCICMQGVILAPVSLYEAISTSSPVLISPNLECRYHYQGQIKKDASEPEVNCTSQWWRSLERWFMVPLADSAHLDREALAIWRATKDESIYNLQDFRLYTKDMLGNLQVPFEKDFHGLFAYFRGLDPQNGSKNNELTKEIQIGQHCINLKNNNDTLVYLSKQIVRFDNTSVKYGCSKNSFQLETNKIGLNKESICYPQFPCFPTPFTHILRYEELLMANDRPLPHHNKVIRHFRNALSTDFSDILELRLKKFKPYGSSKGTKEIKALQFFNKSIQLMQKSLQTHKQKRLVENTVKLFVIGTGGNFDFLSSEDNHKEILSFLTECLEKAEPITVDKKNCTDDDIQQTPMPLIKTNQEDEQEDISNYKKNDLVVLVIRTVLEFTRTVCIAALPDKVKLHRIFENAIQKIFNSPLFFEKYWFLETVHVQVLLPGLNQSFLKSLEHLLLKARNDVNDGKFFVPRIKWFQADELYRYKKRTMKPLKNTESLCEGFLIWHKQACCLQVDSNRELSPKMTSFENGPVLCE